ncbi:carboxyl transferase domain-containing protein [Streptomyces sp. L7]
MSIIEERPTDSPAIPDTVPATPLSTPAVPPASVPDALRYASLRVQRRTAELGALRRQVTDGPSEKATQAQHAKGKLTARERLDLLFDPDTFTEVEGLRRHTVPTGFGLEYKKPYTDGVQSPAGASSTAAPSSRTPTTSASSAAPSARPTPRRSTN